MLSATTATETGITMSLLKGTLRTEQLFTNVNSLNASVTNLYFVEQQLETSAMNFVGARCRLEQVYLNNTQNSNNGDFDNSGGSRHWR